jgi:hypothetical protein
VPAYAGLAPQRLFSDKTIEEMRMHATDLVFARYGDLPHMSRHYAERIEAFICEQRFANILELGFAHGKK